MSKGDVLTLEEVLETVRGLDYAIAPQRPFSFGIPQVFSGMKIIEAPMRQVLELSKDFKWCSDEFRAEMDKWLLDKFGMTSVVPKGTVYLMANNTIGIMRPEQIAMIRNLT